MRGWAALPAVLALAVALGLAPASEAAGPDADASVLDQLAELEAKHAEVQARVAQLKTKRGELDRRLRAARDMTAAVEADIAEQQTLLAGRLRAAYKLQTTTTWEYLLASRDFSDYVLRREYLRRLWRADQARIAAYSASIAAVREQAAAATERQRELDALLARLGEEEKTLAAKLADRQTFVDRVRGDERLRRRAEAEMEEASRGLARQVATLGPEAEAAPSGAFAAQKGQLACPVKARVAVGFGEAIEGRVKRFHGGWDFAAPRGAPVVAPAEATVVFAGTMRGFGNLVILDHGEQHYTLYAHLQALARASGQTVKAGELIGHVGDTGSLKGPYLYFELRRKGKAIDPEGWFACGR
ncbi:MAG: peptidase M23 [Myxococcales bacterium]|nr:MAG: peptidase M23 [Myxococcales bacterium]